MEISARPVSVSAAREPVRAQFDDDLTTLREHADAWPRLGFAGKIRHLAAMRARTIEAAEEWVELAASAKGIAGTPLTGEEWLSGPYALLIALDRLIAAVGDVARSGSPELPGSVRSRGDAADGSEQVAVDVFPVETSDKLLLSGVRAEVWIEPGITPETLGANTGSGLRDVTRKGSVTLVLGAGNIASIPPLDALTVLYTHGSVVMLKLNTVNAYLAPIFKRIFASLIEDGFVRIAEGGADIGEFLCAHSAVDAIHLTGGERTYDAIVFGTDAGAAERKAQRRPLLEKPITSELGNVTPVIVVPGPWSAPDLVFQAQHVATMKLHNAGANCIAAQVLVTARSWDLGPRFLDQVREALASAPARPSYYPGSLDRQRAISAHHPHVETIGGPGGGDPRTFVQGLDPQNLAEPLFRTEVFGPVLAQTGLPGDDAATFLRNAVAFCNDVLAGTLGAAILIHPRTIKELGPVFDEALAALRYGSITINTWPGVAFLLPTASWGAFPGNTVTDVGSGVGIVHNAFQFDRPQKTIVRAPFAPFPRSLGDGERTLLPVPPWFVNHRRGAAVGRRLFAFAANPSPLRLAATALAAMRS
jgi:aldehyde dehydrogenase (NAD(P)+)